MRDILPTARLAEDLTYGLALASAQRIEIDRIVSDLGVRTSNPESRDDFYLVGFTPPAC